MTQKLEYSSSGEYKIGNKSNKLLTFRLYGNFAHFNQPISNRFRNTYSIIPKPQLLGLIGSIAGLGGYKNRTIEPEFYSKIGDLKVFIKSNNISDRKFTVNYNSLNSFLNNRKDTDSPNVIINEQVILYPDYEIGLLLDESNELHKVIIKNIQNNRSVFHIYLGKNEFFANIQYISLKDYEINSRKETVCSSIFPFYELEKEGNGNIKLEMLPVDFDDNFKYTYNLMAIPQKECKVQLKNPENFIMSEGNVYYVF
ncbi:CRISPR-associated protein Cas5 [Methanococcoides orientis]|uniref:CRISPR-associated protein Cas5 n=1 Tax=Methanococcoides orientis TaxID=2822137 RepID=UPI001E3FCA29|nr:CRISPR-associated protein Cas5 [Methanococcoides orientis]UGV41617.1 CRISPR-associated protein Cas5 [Methanococcoides orientis]